MDSEKSRLDAAVGNDAELEDTLAHVQMPHPPLQLKRVDGRQGPRRAKALGSKNHDFMAIRERGNARQPLLPQLLSGDAEMESKPEEVLPAGGRHIAERMHTRHNVTERENQRQAALQKQAKRSQAGDELAEEMEALQRARLSRQVTEDRIAKKHMPGLRKTLTHYSTSIDSTSVVLVATRMHVAVIWLASPDVQCRTVPVCVVEWAVSASSLDPPGSDSYGFS